MLSGTRTLVVVRLRELIEFMKAHGFNGTISTVRAYSFLLAMTKDTIAKYKDASRVFCTITVGKSDFMYLPAGCVVAEQCKASKDCFGLKTHLVVKTDVKANPDLQMLVQHLAASDAPEDKDTAACVTELLKLYT